MKPCLIQFYDERLKEIAEVSTETATYFANTYGLDYVCESTGSYLKNPHMKKVELTLRELNAGRPYVVYADVDIVFIRDLPTDFLLPITSSLSVMSINGRLETSFFVAYNTPETRGFFADWLERGMADQAKTDEDSFYRLCMIRPKPMPIVTTAWKHFYATSSGNRILFPMKMFKKHRF